MGEAKKTSICRLFRRYDRSAKCCRRVLHSDNTFGPLPCRLSDSLGRPPRPRDAPRIESAGFESGAQRAIRRALAAGFDPRFGDLAIDKAAAAGAAALNKKPDAICRRLHWRTSCRRTRTA